MEIIGLQHAIEERQEKNTFSIFEITTTPGLAERIDYMISWSGAVIDRIVFSSYSENNCLVIWDGYQGNEKVPFNLHDLSLVKVQWKSVVRPNDGLANLKYTLGA